MAQLLLWDWHYVTSPGNSGTLKLGGSKLFLLTSLAVWWMTFLRRSSVGTCAEKHHGEFLCHRVWLFFPRAFSDVQARVHSQGLHTSMSHLRNYPYFHTSHKVPDILIAGTIHQVPFVAEREILACERTVWVEYRPVKTLKEEKANRRFNCENTRDRSDTKHLNTNTKRSNAIMVYELKDIIFPSRWELCICECL